MTLFLASCFFSGFVFATGPTNLSYQAKIYRPDNSALEAANVNFKFEILNPTENCVLYSENFNAVNMTGTGGLVSFVLGSGTQSYVASGSTITGIFDNSVASYTCGPTSGVGAYSPTASHGRKIRMSFQESGFGMQTVPPMAVNSVPYASYAYKSLLATSATFATRAASATTAATLNGYTQNDFATSNGLGAGCSGGQVLTFNGSAFVCVVQTGGASAAITSLSFTAPISNTGTASSPVISITQSSLTTNGYLSSTDFTTFNNKLSATSAAITTALGAEALTVSSTITLNGDVTGNKNSNVVSFVNGKTASQVSTSVDDTLAATNLATASTIAKRDSSGNIIFNNIGSNITSMNRLNLYNGSNAISFLSPVLSASYTLTFPASGGATGQVLTTDGAGILSWVSPSAGSVVSVSGTANEVSVTGSAFNPVVGLANNGVVSGTYTKVIVDSKGRVSSGSQLVASDIPNLDASKLTTGVLPFARGGTGLNVSGTANQILGMNATASALEYKSVSAGTNISITNNAGELVISSSNGGGSVTNVSATAPLVVVSSTTTPTLSITQATNLTDGYLSFTDWLSFNNKVTSVSATQFFTITGTTSSPVLDLADVGSGIVSGTQYTKVTLDNKGRVVSGAQINSSDVTTALGYTPVSAAAASQWTTSGTSVFYNSGNVGIGVSSPIVPLHVYGANSSNGIFVVESSNGSNTILSVGSTSSGAHLVDMVNSGGSVGIAGAANVARLNVGTLTASGVAVAIRGISGQTGDLLRVDTGTGSTGAAFKITSSGFVGAGTSTPTTTLEVSGTLKFAGSTTPVSGGVLTSDATGIATWRLPASGNAGTVTSVSATAPLVVVSSTTTPTLSITQANSSADGYLSFTDWLSFNNKVTSVSATQFFTITGTTSSPVLDLTDVGSGIVSGTQYTKVTVDGKGRVVSGAQINSSDVTTALGYTPVSAAAASQWTTSGTSVFYNTGNVGIGVSSPIFKLDISGGSTRNISPTDSGFITARVSGKAGFLASGLLGAGFNFDDTGKFAIGKAARADIDAGVYTGTDLVTVLASGNVGIGTQSPSTTLDVSGTLKFAGSTTPVSGGVLTSDATGIATWRLPTSVSATQWTTSGTSIFYNLGKVGIGTATPDENLTVVGTALATNYKVSTGGTAGNPAFLNNGNQAGVFFPASNEMAFATQTVERMKIDSLGNVGIGTSSPATTLEVSGTLKFAGSTTPVSGGVLTSDATGIATWRLPASGNAGTVTSVSATAPLVVVSSTTTPTLSIAQANSSTDGYLSSVNWLSFNNKVTSVSATQFFTITGTTSSPVLDLADVGSTIVSGTQYTKVTVDSKGRVVSGAQINSSDVTTALGYTPVSAAAASQWTTSGTSVFYNTGNVGIGTANPSRKLDIQGTTNFGDTVEINTNPWSQTGDYTQFLNYGFYNSTNTNTGTIRHSYNFVNTSDTRSFNNLYAQENSIQNNSNGSGTNLAGSKNSVSLNGTGSITNAYGSHNIVNLTNATGSLANGYGVYADVVKSASGTLTNAYGVYIDALAGTNKWGVYQAGSADNNYFAGNLGLGTTSPATTFDVSGTVKFAGSTTPVSGGVLTSDATGIATWRFPSSASSQWTTSGTDIFYNTGNVGIGVSAPTAKLQINGNINVSNTITTSSTELVLEQTGDSLGTTRLRLRNRSGSNGAIFQNPGLNLVDLGFLESSDQQSNLRYERRNGDLLSPLNTTGEFQFVDDTENGKPGVRYFSSGISATVITSGNFGIGVSTPATTLDVSGTLKFAGSTTPVSGGVLTSDATGIATWRLPASGGSSQWTTSGTSIFYAGGNVGIGTSDTASALLNIGSTGSNATISNPTSGNGVILSAAGNGVTGQLRIIGQSNGWIDNQATAYFQMRTGVNNNVTFVGGTYATDTQINRLQFTSNFTTFTDNNYNATPVPTALTEIINTTASKSNLKIKAAPAQSVDILSVQNSSGTVLLNVNSLGYLGIGTSSPATTLDVSGTLKFAGSTTPVSGGVLTSDVNGIATWRLPASGGSSQWTTSGTSIFYNTGNVGIGVSSPTAALEVSGTIRTPAATIAAGTTTINTLQSNYYTVSFTSNACAALTLSNLQDGQAYVIATSGVTSGACSFTSAGLTFKYAPANAAVTADSVYTLIKVGSIVYVSWITGFQ